MKYTTNMNYNNIISDLTHNINTLRLNIDLSAVKEFIILSLIITTLVILVLLVLDYTLDNMWRLNNGEQEKILEKAIKDDPDKFQLTKKIYAQ